MKKILLILIYISTLVLSFSASAKELMVGLANDDYAPYYYEYNGEYRGAALEVSEAVAEALGHKLVYLRAPWKRIQAYLRSGKIDMMILYSKTPERALDVIFTDTPHIYESSDLFVLKKSLIKHEGSLSDLKTYKFGNVRGYSHGIEYNNSKKLSKMQITNEQQLIRILIRGRIDIGVGSKPVIIRTAFHMGLMDKLRFLTPPIDVGANYIAFSKARKDAQELADEFSSQLKTYMKTDQYKAILQSYNFDTGQN